jgi:hypothetical protein
MSQIKYHKQTPIAGGQQSSSSGTDDVSDSPRHPRRNFTFHGHGDTVESSKQTPTVDLSRRHTTVPHMVARTSTDDDEQDKQSETTTKRQRFKVNVRIFD